MSQRPEEPTARGIIHPYDRIYWDIFVFGAIMVSAFEIPYDWLVGWQNPTLALAFDLGFFIVFSADMVLNALTMRERSGSGLWGWRRLAWWTGAEDEDAERVDRRSARVLDSNPDIAMDYMRSGWFPIDLLSAIPWGLLAASFSPLTSLRLLRLLRLARLFRVLRLTRAIYLLERIRRAVPSVPSVERLLFIAMSIPWIAHLFACLVFHFERAHGTSVPTYSDAFHAMWMALIARKTVLGEGVSDPTYYLGMAGVLLSVFVIAAVTGNLAALYTSIDFGRDENPHVVMENHSVVVGWNHNVFSVITQLLAAERDPRSASGDIVLLSSRTDAEVWRAFDEFGLSFDPRRLTVHTGSTQSIQNIRRLSIGRARHVILLGGLHDEGRSRDLMRRADGEVLKTLLACCHAFDLDEWARASRRGRGRLGVVTAVHSRRVATMLQQGMPRRSADSDVLDVAVVDVEDMMARCIAQVTSDAVLSHLLRELFSYTVGDESRGGSHEIYVVELDELRGPDGRGLSLDMMAALGERAEIVFDDLVGAMPDALPIGFYTRPEVVPQESRHLYAAQLDDRTDARPRVLFVNPGFRSDDHAGLVEVPFEREHALEEGDAIVVIARNYESACRVDPRSLGSATDEGFMPGEVTPRAPRRVLVLGDGRKAGKVLELLPDLLPRGSHVMAELVVDLPESTHSHMRARGMTLQTVHVTGLTGWNHEAPGECDVPEADLEGCDTVVVMSGDDGPERHDANILMALTALESHRRRHGDSEHTRAHVVELLDAHNVELADAFGHVSSLISPELVSNYLVQLAHDTERGMVYRELLDIEGNELYVVELGRYVPSPGEEVSFFDVMARARACCELAIGYVYTVGEGTEELLLLAPRGERRELGLSEVERRFGERVTRIVVAAARHPDMA